MIVKWIRCEVLDSKRESFGRAQERWKTVGECEGFVGQCGGFVEGGAVVLGFWRDSGCYDAFMEEAHDSIFEKTGQGGSYDGISVSLFSVELRAEEVRSALGSARSFRVQGTGPLRVDFDVEDGVSMERAWTVLPVRIVDR